MIHLISHYRDRHCTLHWICLHWTYDIYSIVNIHYVYIRFTLHVSVTIFTAISVNMNDVAYFNSFCMKPDHVLIISSATIIHIIITSHSHMFLPYGLAQYPLVIWIGILGTFQHIGLMDILCWWHYDIYMSFYTMHLISTL